MIKNTTIYIPSRGRPDKQITITNLPEKILKNVVILVDKNERQEYKNSKSIPPSVKIKYLPKKVTGIGKVRQWAIDNCKTDYLFLIDDDMTFCVREKGTTKLRRCEGKDTTKMLSMFLKWMKKEKIPVVGLSARQGNNHMENDWSHATRQMNFHGIDVKRFKKIGLRFDGQEVMEDFYMILTLLTHGIANRVSYKYCWNQTGSGAEGGCSSYRTWELQKACAEKLRDAFPEFVTVVRKTTTSVWKDFPDRYDVRVQWKKAYRKGLTK